MGYNQWSALFHVIIQGPRFLLHCCSMLLYIAVLIGLMRVGSSGSHQCINPSEWIETSHEGLVISFKEGILIFHIPLPLTFLWEYIIICPHLNSKGLGNRVPTWKVMSHSLFSKEGRRNAYLGTLRCLQRLNSWCLELLGSEPNSVWF